MSAIEKRDEYAAKILAGFAANPAIFAPNPGCGWALVNCTDAQLAAYAVQLANELFSAMEAIGLDGATKGENDAMKSVVTAPETSAAADECPAHMSGCHVRDGSGICPNCKRPVDDPK